MKCESVCDPRLLGSLQISVPVVVDHPHRQHGDHRQQVERIGNALRERRHDAQALVLAAAAGSAGFARRRLGHRCGTRRRSAVTARPAAAAAEPVDSVRPADGVRRRDDHRCTGGAGPGGGARAGQAAASSGGPGGGAIGGPGRRRHRRPGARRRGLGAVGARLAPAEGGQALGDDVRASREPAERRGPRRARRRRRRGVGDGLGLGRRQPCRSGSGAGSRLGGAGLGPGDPGRRAGSGRCAGGGLRRGLGRWARCGRR